MNKKLRPGVGIAGPKLKEQSFGSTSPFSQNSQNFQAGCEAGPPDRHALCALSKTVKATELEGGNNEYNG